MKAFSIRYKALAGCLGALMSVVPAVAAQLDLRDFFRDVEDVAVSEDGSTATLRENPEFTSVILELHPYLDEDLIIPGVDTFLRFGFDFFEPPGNNDMFVAFLFDGLTGFSLGGIFEFVTDESEAGTIEFDLSSLVGGEKIGLHFALIAADDDDGLNSSLTISNVRLEEDPNGTPVIPEGDTAILLLSGLAAIGFCRRRITS